MVISDIVIVTTSTTAPTCTTVTPAKESSSTPGSHAGLQLKLKVDETGVGLVQEILSSEVGAYSLRPGCLQFPARVCEKLWLSLLL
jgi:hypothetical protein